MSRSALLATLALVLSFVGWTRAADWTRFRGPDGSAVSEEKGLPTTWSAEEGVVWKTELPGPGASSPITTGDKVFVTCYRGVQTGGSVADLERLLVCADRATGRILWTDAVKGKANEDRPGTQFMQHGYASSTPATDGERVFVLFGKSGVLAYDLDGKRLWQVDVGEGSAPSGWGSAASPILYKNLVLVNAAAEGPALVALDKETGKEVWKAEAEGLTGCWSTPVLVDIGEGKQDLVLNVPGEVWGFNPETGKLRWYCEGIPGRTVNPSVVAKDGIVYAIGSGPGGRGGAAAVAVRAGGRGDVNATHVVWRQSVGSYVPSPVIAGEHLYWINNQSIAHCLKLADGEPVLGQSGRRLSGVGDIYASLLAADGKLYAFSRFNGAFVYSATPQFEELAHNELGSDAGRCNASPAVSKGQLLVRSDKYLYCLGAK